VREEKLEDGAIFEDNEWLALVASELLERSTEGVNDLVALSLFSFRLSSLFRALTR